MSVPYDTFTDAFLSKIMEYDFVTLKDFERNDIIDGYMKRSMVSFNKVCSYNFLGTANDTIREFEIDVPAEDLIEIADIVSEGMVSQWMKPYTYKQENLTNVLNTRDFTTYSPAELLSRITSAYTKSQKDFTNMVREYSYNHGDLSDLHL